MAVVDASIVVDWVAPGVDPGGPAARLLARLAQSTEAILAPRLVLEETANALVTGIRRHRWTGAQADAAFLLLRSLPVDLVDQPQDLDRAYELSRRYDEHPVYDLVYVAVAERLGEQLVTADDALRRRLAALPFIVGPA
jgi:predicted nucleic acid-binding protein